MRISKRTRTRGGFTLIELMISVSIIGVLAAIAIPNYLTFQARSRRSEAYANLSGIARSYKGYFAERGRYPDMSTDGLAPTLPWNGGIGTKKIPWDAPTQAFFAIVGWQSDGDVFYTYDISAPDGGLCSCTACFTATAHGDVDGDTGWSALMYSSPQRDAGGMVIGECPSRIGALFAPVYGGVPRYDEVSWNPSRDEY